MIVIALAVVVIAIFFAIRRGREKRVEQKRIEAGQLRDEAEERLARAGQREAVAQQEGERARRERAAAEDAVRRAEDVDPDVPSIDEDPGRGRPGATADH